MGLQKFHDQQHYELADIGVLDGPPIKAFDHITALAAASLVARSVAFFVADESTQSLIVRSSSALPSISDRPLNLPLPQSLTRLVRAENRAVEIGGPSGEVPVENAVELGRFLMESFLGVPVLGPAGEPIGALAAMYPGQHAWTREQRERLELFAYLLHQQILLRAALETLRLMAQERGDARLT